MGLCSIRRYDAELGGVLLAYGKLRSSTSAPHATAPGQAPICRIFDELPPIHARVAMEAVLFAPQLGRRLTGTVTALSNGHVSLLIGTAWRALGGWADSLLCCFFCGRAYRATPCIVEATACLV